MATFDSLYDYTNIFAGGNSSSFYAYVNEYVATISSYIYTNRNMPYGIETQIEILVSFARFLAVKTANGWDTVEAPFLKRGDDTFGAILAIYVRTSDGWKMV